MGHKLLCSGLDLGLGKMIFWYITARLSVHRLMTRDLFLVYFTVSTYKGDTYKASGISHRRAVRKLQFLNYATYFAVSRGTNQYELGRAGLCA